jgi:hypothetical protein
MKKSTILAAAALAGMGAAVVAPSAVADSRITVPFVPVSVWGSTGDDGLDVPPAP